MLTNFLLILKDLVKKNCVLQSFHPGYVPELNANQISKYPAFSIWFDTLVGRKEQQDNGLFRSYELTCEFLALQGYFNDNSFDPDYKHELYKVQKWDELQQLSDVFFYDLKNIEKQLAMNPAAPFQFVLNDISSGSRMSRSTWLNTQAGSQYKANQHNARLISVMQTFHVAFPLHICNELCCTCQAEDYCLPPLKDINPRDLVKPSDLKC